MLLFFFWCLKWLLSNSLELYRLFGGAEELDYSRIILTVTHVVVMEMEDLTSWC